MSTAIVQQISHESTQQPGIAAQVNLCPGKLRPCAGALLRSERGEVDCLEIVPQIRGVGFEAARQQDFVDQQVQLDDVPAQFLAHGRVCLGFGQFDRHSNARQR